MRGPSAIQSSGEDRDADHLEDHRRRLPVRDLDPYRSLSEVQYAIHHDVWPNVDVHVPVRQVPEHLIVNPACSVASMNWPWNWSERRMLNLITSLGGRISEGSPIISVVVFMWNHRVNAFKGGVLMKACDPSMAHHIIRALNGHRTETWLDPLRVEPMGKQCDSKRTSRHFIWGQPRSNADVWAFGDDQ